MEWMLDTANLASIEACLACYPIVGVTCNPSILKVEGKLDFFSHFRDLRGLIGFGRSLHIQVTAEDREGILADARTILNQVDGEVYIKIPVTEPGLAAIQQLKAQGVHVTATAVYSKIQGYLAMACGADYIALYHNRMENLDADPCGAESALEQMARSTGSTSKVLAASFKNFAQVNCAAANGAHAVTIPPELLRQALGTAAVEAAVKAFNADWRTVYGASNISDLETPQV